MNSWHLRVSALRVDGSVPAVGGSGIGGSGSAVGGSGSAVGGSGSAVGGSGSAVGGSGSGIGGSGSAADLEVGAGAMIGVVGAPGVGKSALGRAVAGLARPGSGAVTMDGRDVAELVGTRAGRSAFRRAVRHVGPDLAASFEPDRTMRDALRLPMRVLRRITGTMADVAIDAVLRDLWLDPHLASLPPYRLSPAHLRLFALARALVVQPRLVVWDEPADVPVAAQAALLTALGRHNRAHGTAFLVLARSLPLGGPALNRLVLRDGRLAAAADGRLAQAA